MLYPDMNSQKKTQQTRYHTALYLRLSREDGDKTESDSIANQRTLLEAYAAEHGFILRWPQERQAATGMVFEPWHWRYVGVENAARINASGLCFEEYIQTLRDIAAEV